MRLEKRKKEERNGAKMKKKMGLLSVVLRPLFFD